MAKLKGGVVCCRRVLVGFRMVRLGGFRPVVEFKRTNFDVLADHQFVIVGLKIHNLLNEIVKFGVFIQSNIRV